MNAVNAITASSGYIYTRKGKSMDYNGGYQTPDVIAAAAGSFVHSNGSPFYPGGTSWYACQTIRMSQNFHTCTSGIELEGTNSIMPVQLKSAGALQLTFEGW